MNANFEFKKLAGKFGEAVKETNKGFWEWFDKRAKYSAEREKEQAKTLGILAFGALPIAISRILYGTGKIVVNGFDTYLLDDHWRKSMRAGYQWANKALGV